MLDMNDLLNAVEAVSTWELPEDAFAGALNGQLPMAIGSDPADRLDTIQA